jgi:hypothetical protein
MRNVLPQKLEAGRLLTGYYASKAGDQHGAFQIHGPNGTDLVIMSSGTGNEAEGWEHVSISTRHRTPNWGEMCFVKGLFWTDEECVIQYHPPASEHINHHPYCLHLWRPTELKIPMPPSLFV